MPPGAPCGVRRLKTTWTMRGGPSSFCWGARRRGCSALRPGVLFVFGGGEQTLGEHLVRRLAVQLRRHVGPAPADVVVAGVRRDAGRLLAVGLGLRVQRRRLAEARAAQGAVRHLGGDLLLGRRRGDGEAALHRAAHGHAEALELVHAEADGAIVGIVEVGDDEGCQPDDGHGDVAEGEVEHVGAGEDHGRAEEGGSGEQAVERPEVAVEVARLERVAVVAGE
mmetsp:Transcript_8924/g.25920  ORF Transcript_8924/g.25920 Transcript_8924/m.25920 type:complete len:223 (-) Transcript_8924:1600-2268(-)